MELDPILQTILDRHKPLLRGSLAYQTLQSKALASEKGFFVYTPPGWTKKMPVNMIIAFRGHEREWVNIQEDPSRTSTIVEKVEKLILEEQLPPTVIVFPGLSSDDNSIHSLGVDMVGKWPKNVKGLGKGQFYTYLTKEFLPVVEAMFTVRKRILTGFSLGAYTSTLLSVLQPGYPDHVVMYDGLFMWNDMHDPRKRDPGINDSVWLKHPIFDAALGKPRISSALRRWNTSDAIVQKTHQEQQRLRNTTFWISTAAYDGDRGNKERGVFYADLLKKQGVQLGWQETVEDPHAEHSWYWAEHCLLRALQSIQ